MTKLDAVGALRDDAESVVREIRELLREAHVDGTQYEDVSTIDCVRQLIDSRDGAVENWRRCHERHMTLEKRENE